MSSDDPLDVKYKLLLKNKCDDLVVGVGNRKAKYSDLIKGYMSQKPPVTDKAIKIAELYIERYPLSKFGVLLYTNTLVQSGKIDEAIIHLEDHVIKKCNLRHRRTCVDALNHVYNLRLGRVWKSDNEKNSKSILTHGELPPTNLTISNKKMILPKESDEINKKLGLKTKSAQSISYLAASRGTLIGCFSDKSSLFYGDPANLTLVHRPKVKQIACGRSNYLVLVQSGEIYTYGSGENLVLNHTEEGVVFQQISAGHYHFGAVTSNGKLSMWGIASNGRLGLLDNGDKSIRLPTIIELPNLTNSNEEQKVKKVSCGSHHTAVLLENGEVYTFGRNDRKQLGYEATEYSTICCQSKIKKCELHQVDNLDSTPLVSTFNQEMLRYVNNPEFCDLIITSPEVQIHAHMVMFGRIAGFNKSLRDGSCVLELFAKWKCDKEMNIDGVVTVSLDQLLESVSRVAKTGNYTKRGKVDGFMMLEFLKYVYGQNLYGKSNTKESRELVNPIFEIFGIYTNKAFEPVYSLPHEFTILDEFSDITLVSNLKVDGNKTWEFKGHRVLLGSRSEYFKSLIGFSFSHSPSITSGDEKDTNPRVRVDSNLALPQLTSYLYYDQINTEVNGNQLLGLIILSNRYQLPRLGEAAARSIYSSIDLTNFNHLLQFAQINQSIPLLRSVVKYLFNDRNRLSQGLTKGIIQAIGYDQLSELNRTTHHGLQGGQYTPRPLHSSIALPNPIIKDIECGDKLTLLQDMDGRIIQIGYGSDQKLKDQLFTVMANGDHEVNADMNNNNNNGPGFIDVVSMSCGRSHCSIMDKNNNIYCWGSGHRGQINKRPTIYHEKTLLESNQNLYYNNVTNGTHSTLLWRSNQDAPLMPPGQTVQETSPTFKTSILSKSDPQLLWDQIQTSDESDLIIRVYESASSKFVKFEVNPNQLSSISSNEDQKTINNNENNESNNNNNNNNNDCSNEEKPQPYKELKCSSGIFNLERVKLNITTTKVNDKRYKLLNLFGYPEEIVKSVVMYLYTKEIQIQGDQILELLTLSSVLCLFNLIDKIFVKLRDSFTVDSALSMLHILQSRNQFTMQFIQNYICKYLKQQDQRELMKSDQYNSLSPSVRSLIIN